MKILATLFIALLFFVGCGGDDSNGNSSADNHQNPTVVKSFVCGFAEIRDEYLHYFDNANAQISSLGLQKVYKRNASQEEIDAFKNAGFVSANDPNVSFKKQNVVDGAEARFVTYHSEENETQMYIYGSNTQIGDAEFDSVFGGVTDIQTDLDYCSYLAFYSNSPQVDFSTLVANLEKEGFACENVATSTVCSKIESGKKYTISPNAIKIDFAKP